MAEDSVVTLTSHVAALYVERQRKIYFDLRGVEPPASAFPDPSAQVRPPLRDPKGFGVTTNAAKYWLTHCAALSGRMSDFDHEARRGYTIACKLLGLSWNDTQWAIGATRSAGVAKAAEIWAPYMSAPDQRYVGHVYVARRADGIGPIKVGFSTNVKKRMTRLTFAQKRPVEALACHPGTMLVEWALHMDLGRNAGHPEWYAPEQIPDWLFGGLKREAA